MRSTFGMLALALCLALPGAARAAADEYDDSQSHPLRVVTYLVHPIGMAFEWVLFRPFHQIVAASPETEYVFGHRPHGPYEFSENRSE
jgi:hypothetical protein